MALFYKLMRNARTAELLEQHPREYLLLSLIALRMGADGAPARIGLTDYAINGMGEKGVAMRYRRAKELLESWGLARFESSTSGTLAYLLPSPVFGMGGVGVKKDRANDRAETEQKTEGMTEQIELVLDKKDRAETEQKTEGMTERLTPNKELNTRELNTPPIIPQGGENSSKILKLESSKVGEVETAKNTFEDFWKVYPARNGRKVGKQNAEEKFKKLPLTDRPAVIQAARNYALSGQMAKDAERFLKSDYWRDWVGLTSNGLNGQKIATKSKYSGRF